MLFFLLMLFLFMTIMLSKISEEKQRSPFTEFALDEVGGKKNKKKTNIPLHKFPFSTSALPFNILWERGRGK